MWYFVCASVIFSMFIYCVHFFHDEADLYNNVWINQGHDIWMVIYNDSAHIIINRYCHAVLY